MDCNKNSTIYSICQYTKLVTGPSLNNNSTKHEIGIQIEVNTEFVNMDKYNLGILLKKIKLFRTDEVVAEFGWISLLKTRFPFAVVPHHFIFETHVTHYNTKIILEKQKCIDHNSSTHKIRLSYFSTESLHKIYCEAQTHKQNSHTCVLQRAKLYGLRS